MDQVTLFLTLGIIHAMVTTPAHTVVSRGAGYYLMKFSRASILILNANTLLSTIHPQQTKKALLQLVMIAVTMSLRALVQKVSSFPLIICL